MVNANNVMNLTSVALFALMLLQTVMMHLLSIKSTNALNASLTFKCYLKIRKQKLLMFINTLLIGHTNGSSKAVDTLIAKRPISLTESVQNVIILSILKMVSEFLIIQILLGTSQHLMTQLKDL